MEQIIYHIIRCGLVHECNIDDTISFTDTTYIGDWDKKILSTKRYYFGVNCFNKAIADYNKSRVEGSREIGCFFEKKKTPG